MRVLALSSGSSLVSSLVSSLKVKPAQRNNTICLSGLLRGRKGFDVKTLFERRLQIKNSLSKSMYVNQDKGLFPPIPILLGNCACPHDHLHHACTRLLRDTRPTSTYRLQQLIWTRRLFYMCAEISQLILYATCRM